MIDGWPCEVAMYWISLIIVEEKLAWFQEMAKCNQATAITEVDHDAHGVTKPQ